MSSTDIRYLLMPGETQLKFDERVPFPVHIYPGNRCVCGGVRFGVVCEGERKGESWCLSCARDDPQNGD